MTKIPVILDTDIGDDMDDTWALALLLRMPEVFDLKLIVTSGFGHHAGRAQIVAKFLSVCGKPDVPIGLGCQNSASTNTEDPFGTPLPQGDWAADYNMADHSGQVSEDGIQLLIDTALASEVPMALITIGPCGNIAEALRRQPKIAHKLHFVGMHGSINQGYGPGSDAAAEYNVYKDVPACRACFQAPFLTKRITPLDTCGAIRLKGELYKELLSACSTVPLVKAIIGGYDTWYATIQNPSLKKVFKPDSTSTILFDTVAVLLASSIIAAPAGSDREQRQHSSAYLELETHTVKVTDDGFTRVTNSGDPEGGEMLVALNWKDGGLRAFRDFLVEALVGGTGTAAEAGARARL